MEIENCPTLDWASPPVPEESAEDTQLRGLIRQTVAGTLQALEEEKVPASLSTKQVDLVGLLLCILEKVWCLLLAGLLTAGVFGWRALGTAPTYAATAKLYILGSDRASVSMADLQLGEALAQDYQAVFQTWEVYEAVRRTLRLPYSYEQTQNMLTVTAPEDTRLLYITITAPDALLAADMANAYAAEAKAFIRDTMKAEPPGDFSPARVPQTAQGVSVELSVMLGFLLGAVLAIAVVTLAFVLDTSPRTPEEIRRDGGMNPLAIIPEGKKQGNDPATACTEGFHTLAVNLTYCHRGTVLITSRYSGEGKTYVSENLLYALAAMGRKVVLVDGNLRRGENRKTPGMTDFLTGRCQWKDILLPTDLPNAWHICAGHLTADPLRLLDSEKMERMMRELNERFDVVLLEAPPAGILADAAALAKLCDGAILVTGYRRGTLSQLRQSADTIERTGCPVLGAVLNRVPMNKLSNRCYYYRNLTAAAAHQRKGRKP